MAHLVIPSPAQVRAVLDESHTLWGAGLSRADYVAMWDELAQSPWGRKRFSWRALVDDDGEVLSSLKLYRPEMRLGEATGRACALGAVFTPRGHRRRGHAATLIRAVLHEADAREDGPGFLFTDIGTDYYASLGFAALPCEDVLGGIPPSAGGEGEGVRFRTLGTRDLDEVSRTHERFCAGRPIAVVRDLEHWEFLLLRAETFFRRLDGSGLEGRFMIAEERGAGVGYLVGVLGAGEWNLREAGAFDDDPRTLRRILLAAAADAREAGATTVWGWLPRSWIALVPEWRLRPQPRPRAIPMLRPRGGAALPAAIRTIEGAFLPYLDQF